MYENKQYFEQFSLKREQEVHDILFDPAEGQIIFPNCTPISAGDKKQINKKRLVLSLLLKDFQFSKSKDDMGKIYKAFFPQDETYNAIMYLEEKKEENNWKFYSLYSSNGLIFQLLNKILRSDPDPSIYLWVRFFFKQMFTRIHNDYRILSKPETELRFYRGGKMKQDELYKIRKNVGGYIEMEGILSVSVNFKVAKNFCSDVFFQIQIPLRERDEQTDYGYKNISQFSSYAEEEWIINSLNVYKILKAQPVQMHENHSEEKDLETVLYVVLEYGSLAQSVYKKKRGDTLTIEEERLIYNYQSNTHLAKTIKNQGDYWLQMGEQGKAQESYQKLLKYVDKNQIASLQKQKKIVSINLQLCKITAQKNTAKALNKLKQLQERVYNLDQDQIQRLNYESQLLILQVRFPHVKEKELIVPKLERLISIYEKVCSELPQIYFSLQKIVAYNYFFYLKDKRKGEEIILKNIKMLEQLGKYKFSKCYIGFILLKNIILLQEKFYEKFKISSLQADEFIRIAIGDNNLERFSLCNGLGCMYTRIQKYEEALECYIKAHKIHEKFKINQKYFLHIIVNIIHILLKLQRIEEAQKYIKEYPEETFLSIEMDEQLLASYYSLVSLTFSKKQMFFYSVEAMKKCDDILNSIDKTLTFQIEEIGKIKKQINYDELIMQYSKEEQEKQQICPSIDSKEEQTQKSNP